MVLHSGGSDKLTFGREEWGSGGNRGQEETGTLLLEFGQYLVGKEPKPV